VTDNGEIGVGISADTGRTWQHLGIALSEDFSLSSPWVTHDAEAGRYFMIPDTFHYDVPEVWVYATTTKQFPYGWARVKAQRMPCPMRYSSAVHYQGQWWIYSTVGKGNGVPG
jgi:hypothetical protein